jgi:hypothetical protein
MPMKLRAPGRFSTTIGWPNTSASRMPRVRAVMSVGPPGGNGTIMRTGPLGYGV